MNAELHHPDDLQLLSHALWDQAEEEYPFLPSEEELRALYQNDLFDQRLRQLVQPTAAAKRPALHRWGRMAASLAVAAAVGFTGLMTSQAFRDQMFHLLFEEEPTHTTIQVDDSDEETWEQLRAATENQAVYQLTWLPEGFTLQERTDYHTMILERYTTPSGGLFTFDQYALSTTVALDTEDPDVLKHISVSGNECLYVEKHGLIQMLWQNDNAMLHLSAEGLDQATMLRIAEGVAIDVSASRRYSPAERPCTVEWAPDGYELVREHTDQGREGVRELEYRSAAGGSFLVTQQRYNDAQWPNWEEADWKTEAEVGGEYGLILHTGSHSLLFWDDFRFLYTISSDSLSEEELIQIGDSLVLPDPS